MNVIDGYMFEKYVAKIFEEAGYSVELEKRLEDRSGDIDIIAEKEAKRYCIEVKFSRIIDKAVERICTIAEAYNMLPVLVSAYVIEEKRKILYQKKYHVKIFSSANKSLQADCEFYFSFDNFTSCNLIFDITLNQTNKTIFPLSLLPLNPGSNIDLEKINYYHADLYQIGIPAPLCYFNFCENTPADFASKINSSELYLKNGNFYYAVFRALDYTNNIILSDILAPFKIENSIMYFDDDSLIFSDNNAFDIKSKQLPILSDILLNAANLPQDSSYKNTVLCTYDSYGKIKSTFFSSLSSTLLQKKLSQASSGYIIYTDSESFDIGI